MRPVSWDARCFGVGVTICRSRFRCEPCGCAACGAWFRRSGSGGDRRLAGGLSLVAAQSASPTDALAAAAERLLVLVDRLCTASPMVLVGDDLQWADAMSIGVWTRLQAAVNQLPLLLIGVCRPVPTRAELVEARRGGDGRVLRLGALNAVQVDELVGRLVKAAPGPRLVGRAGLAGGNPLYVRELIAGLAQEARINVDAGVAELAGSDTSGPASVSAAINARLGFLSEQAVEVLRLAAVLGARFSVAHLALLAGRPATDLAGVTTEAVKAGVWVEADDRLAFRHELIRQALVDGMPASLRMALHRQAAQALAGAGATVEQVAEQLLAAPRVEDSWAVGWVVQAVPGLTYRAPDIVVELAERVSSSMDPGDPRDERLDAHLATALGLLGRDEQVERIARPVLAGTRDPEVAGRMAWTLGYALARRGLDQQLLDFTGQTLTDRALPAVWTARLRGLLARALGYVGRFEEAATTASQAQAEGKQAGDRYSIGYAEYVLGMIAIRHHGNLEVGLERMNEALLVLGDSPDTAELRLTALGNRSGLLGSIGQPAEAEYVIGETLLLAERIGNPVLLAGARLHAAELYFAWGRWDDALAELTAIAEPSLDVDRRLGLRGHMTLIALCRDDVQTLAEQLRDVEDLALTDRSRYYAGNLRIAWALTAERHGQPAQALARLLAVFDPDSTLRFAELNPEDGPLWQPDVVRLALAMGERPVAEAATEACTALSERQRLPYLHACAQHCHGLLAADPALLHAAAATFAEVRHPLFCAQALENAAVMHAQQGEASAGRAAYGRAVATYTELGAAGNLMRADARLRPLGIRRGVRGARKRPATGWEALSTAESKIAQLVATGQSNPDIAAALFLSRATVQTHARTSSPNSAFVPEPTSRATPLQRPSLSSMIFLAIRCVRDSQSACLVRETWLV